MFDIKGEYKITLPPNPVFSGNRKIGKYFNRKIFLPTGGRHPRSLAPVTDIGANTYRPLATAHTLAPVVPVCFNLFRVMIPTPQRNTGDRGDRNSTHRLLPTGSLLYVCASSSGATSSGGQDTGGRPLTPSLLFASLGHFGRYSLFRCRCLSLLSLCKIEN